MCNRASIKGLILSLAFSFTAMHAGLAAADPISVTGVLDAAVTLALPVQDLRLVFPDFTVDVEPDTQLDPRFSLSAANGSSISLTRTLGAFSGHSYATPGGPLTAADVTGELSFVGPAGILDVPADLRFGSVTEPVTVSGFLRVTQPGRVLFDGTLLGSGTGTVDYEEGFLGNIKLAGYTYQFTAVAATPEPASLLLVATGVAYVVRKRRRASVE